MKKYILIIILLNVSLISILAQTKYCGKIDNEIIINKTYLTISYNSLNKIPNYVGYYLLPSFINGENKRESIFYTENSLPKRYRSYSSNYTGSGYDRGHMSPAADWKFDKQAMHDSFSMANICPQKPILNRQYWAELETVEREWATNCDTLFVITGEICKTKKIIKNGIKIPSYFYKTIVGVKDNAIVVSKAWIYENTNKKQTLKDCETTISNIETIINADVYTGFWFNNLIE